MVVERKHWVALLFGALVVGVAAFLSTRKADTTPQDCFSLIKDEREFIARFEDTSLPWKECWTHTGHLRVAYHYITALKDPLLALQKIREGIQRFNLAHDKPNAYHETLTRFMTAAVMVALTESDPNAASSFDSFNTANSHLSDKNFMLSHYSHDLLFSPLARKEWVEPDLKAYPAASALGLQP
ncbi:Ubiquitin thiolesterase L3 [Balamuthia mandrillaris]